MPRTVTRLFEVANERLVGALFFVAMAVASVQGPTWPVIAKYGISAAVGIGAWTLKERLDQQDKRDDAQDVALKEAVREILAQSKEDKQQVRDLSASAVTRAGEAITAGLELKSAVSDLKAAVAELKDQVREERIKRETREQKELDELRTRVPPGVKR